MEMSSRTDRKTPARREKENTAEPGGEKMDFTHFDEKGNAYMVDVSDKDVTKRTAVACGKIRCAIRSA